MKTANNRMSVRLVVLLFVFASQARAQETKLKWFGHAAFSISTPKGKVLLIDPWLKNPSNPEGKDGKDPLVAVPRVDYILLTHGHRDHLGDAVEIARRTQALLICNPELAFNLVKLADFPAKQVESDYIMQMGNEIQIADGELMIGMTPAVHSSSVFNPKAGPNEPERAYGGSAAGFVIAVRDGPTIYHSGDTAYSRDMELIGENYSIDVALINISQMGSKMSVRAAQSVRAKLAIPDHFGTNAGLLSDPSSFSAELKKTNISSYVMKPGETISFHGRQMDKAK